jgi:hypothetical protein
VNAADSQLREHRTYGRVRSVTSKRWISAVRRTSSHGDPMHVEREMAVLKNAFCSSFACDQHHVTKLCTVRSHRLQCLPSALLWSADGVESTCGSPCGCMRGSQQCDSEHAARRSQRQGPAAHRIGCVYGHDPWVNAEASGRAARRCGGPGQHLQMWSARHPRHAPQHPQGAPSSPLTQVRGSYGCIELRMTGIRSGDGGGRELEVPHPERVFLR